MRIRARATIPVLILILLLPPLAAATGNPFRAECEKLLTVRPPSIETTVNGLAQRWYAPFDGAFPQQLRSLADELGPEYLPLLLDPGIVSRLDDFLAFAKANRLPPLALREAYAAKLGLVTLYRSLWLDPAGLEEIRQNGIKSPYLQKTGEPADPALAAGPFADIMDRLADKGLKLSMSLSEYPELAAAAGASFRYRTGKKPYLFKVIIPEIRTVRHSSPLLKKAVASRYAGMTEPMIRVDWKPYWPLKDPRVEVFTFDTIVPDEIESITEIHEVPALITGGLRNL